MKNAMNSKDNKAIVIWNLDDNVQVDVAYTDFAKAFDQVDDGILLNELLNLTWMLQFLKNFT